MRPGSFLSVLILCVMPMLVDGMDTMKAGVYVPGLGEFMAATQMRHIKLWFAGKARNWPLAAYELDELREGFDDVIKYHPVHKDRPVPIAKLLPELVTVPLTELDEAISSRDEGKFVGAYDLLTEACNACHEQEQFIFNRIHRPVYNPYSDQVFSPTE